MVRELEMVVLTKDLLGHGLLRGDVGTVVHVYHGGEAAEVEFVAADGRTVALLTLKTDSIRPMDRSEILHARPLSLSPQGGGY
ncbi:MAG: DUF4926 domain-containing protein [Limnochordaceae bacterium]|nr:DUF4926 domain-containing protein [Limnochordaceae bacterium]